MNIYLPAPQASTRPTLPPERYSVREELIDHSGAYDPGADVAVLVACMDNDARLHEPGDASDPHESTRQMPIFTSRTEEPGIGRVHRFAEHWKRLLNGEPLTRQEALVMPLQECFED